MKLEFCRQNFQNYSSIQFHSNSPNGSPVVAWRRTDGRTDGQTWKANRRFTQFCDSRSQTYKQQVALTISQHQNSSIAATATRSNTVTPQKQQQQQKQQAIKFTSFKGPRDFPKLKKCLYQIFAACPHNFTQYSVLFAWYSVSSELNFRPEIRLLLVRLL
jgi:hypothetical protein